MEKDSKVEQEVKGESGEVESWRWWLGLFSRIAMMPIFFMLYIALSPAFIMQEAIKFGMTKAERDEYDRNCGGF